jgi:hypothetical protein
MSRITRTRIAVAAMAALAISCGGPAANAFWQTLGANDGGARADTILALAAPAASGSGGAASVSWAQGSTAAGQLISTYTIARYPSAIGGTKVVAGGGCLGVVAARNCSETALPAGTWYYTVTPVVGAWAGTESARSAGIVGDSTPPLVSAVTVPTVVNSSNVNTIPVSVTAEAGSSVKVTVTDTPPAGTPQQTLTQNLTASGSLQTLTFDLSTFSQGTINYTAVATDAAGNANAPKTASSTKDTVAPTATVELKNVPANGEGTAQNLDQIIIKYSGDISSESICSAWRNDSFPLVTGNNAVTVTIDTANNLSVVTTSDAACIPNIGTVALGRSYVNSGFLTFKGTGNSGNRSTVAWDDNSKTLTVTLGSRSGTALTSVGTSSPTVVPPAGVKDAAGNQAVSAAPAVASRF